MLRRLAHNARHFASRIAGARDPLILMYHRVASPAFDPWGLAVSPENFAAQMRVLKRHRQPVTLDRMARALRDGELTPDMVAITFDDAYRDVLEHAKPVVDALEIPATVFVVTDKLGDPRGFWWDRLAVAVLGGTLPQSMIPLSLLHEEENEDIASAFADGDRQRLHLALWRNIRLLPPEARESAVDEVERLFAPVPHDPAPIMTADELHALTASGWVSLGAHTATHPSLPSLTNEGQRDEIYRSKARLEEITGTPMSRLAYPFGDYDEQSLTIARELGFDHAVSVETGPVRDPASLFRLPRHDIKNWNGDKFARRVRWRF